MRLSSKARSLIMRAYTSNRPIATFSQETETELLSSRLMRYREKPMMVLTHEGFAYCKKHRESRDGI